jgi:hypothetical protein
MKSSDIELAIWLHWGRVKNKVLCHNVSWGMFNHECDVLVLEKDNSFTEIEIKVSKADVKKDLTKGHGHNDKRIHKLYFAIPEELYRPDVIELIPERAGIMVVSKQTVTSWNGTTKTKTEIQIKRKPVPTKEKHIATPEQIRKLAYLQQFRFWKERTRANSSELKLKQGNQTKLL